MLRYTFEKIGLILFEKNFFLFFSMKKKFHKENMHCTNRRYKISGGK